MYNDKKVFICVGSDYRRGNHPPVKANKNVYLIYDRKFVENFYSNLLKEVLPGGNQSLCL